MMNQLLGLLDLDLIAAQAATELAKLFLGDLVCVTTAEQSSHLVIRGTAGHRHPSALSGVELPVGSLGLAAVDRGELLMVPTYASVSAAPEFLDLLVRGEGVRGAVSAPVSFLGNPVGTVFVGRRAPHGFADRELDLIQETAQLLAPLMKRSLEAARRTEMARSAERQRLAVELHDEVIPLLFLLRSTVDVLSQSPGTQSTEMQTALADVSDIASSINALVRQTLRSVAPVPADLELLIRVRAVVDRFATHFGVRADLVDFGPARPVPQDASELLVAVVREGLSNIAKHAPGASAVVTVTFQEQSIALVIQDDGPGPPADLELVAPAAAQVGDHFGLANLSWRISAAAGTLSMDGNEDGGTTIRVQLPVGTTTQ